MKHCLKLVLIAVFPIFVIGCSGEKQDSDAQNQFEKPRVKLSESRLQDVDQIEEYTAIVESDVKNNISSNSVMRIEKINVEVGDMVRKGQVLVQMNTAMLQQLKLQIENQRVEFNRIDELYKVLFENYNLKKLNLVGQMKKNMYKVEKIIKEKTKNKNTH